MFIGMAFCIGFVLSTDGEVRGQAVRKDPPAEVVLDKTPLDKLLAHLDAADGKVRTAATKEIFRRGKEALPALKKAGAKQVAPTGGTINTRRLDIVYSLLEGLPPTPPGALAGYKLDSFGLHLDRETTQEEVAAMGKKYGFTLDGTFRADGAPNGYVRLAKDKALADVLRRLLAEEPKVRTVNLNYFER